MKYKDEDWLHEQYHEMGKSMDQISDELGVGKSTIHDWMDKHGIDRRSGSNAHRARKYNFELSNENLDVIYGSLLGDGYITPFGQFELETSEKQFAEFVMSLLPEEMFPSDSPKEYRYHRISSRTSKRIKSIREEWYKDAKKSKIPEYVELNRQTLLHWFLGDGYVNNGYPWVISNFDNTESFIEKSNTDLDEKIYDYEYDGPVVRVKFQNKERFYELVGECPIECYQHKWSVKNE